MRETDDWRLQVDVDGTDPADWLAAIVASETLVRDMSLAFEHRIIASRDGSRVYFYGASREQCEATGRAVRTEARDQGWRVHTELKRWHPYSEEWEQADVPVPTDSAEINAERSVLQKREQSETAARGYPEFEVRVDLPSHHAAKVLFKKLSDEGLSPVRRWKYLIIGVTDEIAGETLASRIKSSDPDSVATVEGTIMAVRDELRTLRPSPFSVFGESNGPSTRDFAKPLAPRHE